MQPKSGSETAFRSPWEAGRYVPGAVGLRSGLCVEGKGMIGFVDRQLGERGVLLKPRANIPLEDRTDWIAEGATGP